MTTFFVTQRDNYFNDGGHLAARHRRRWWRMSWRARADDLFGSRTDRHPCQGWVPGRRRGRLLEMRNSLAEVAARVDKKEVRLTILASATLVGVPLIANAIRDLLSGRWDEQLGRRRPPDPVDAGEAAPHLRGRPIEQLAADLRRLRVAVATDHPRSATHQLANRVAYDHLLMQACEMLDVHTTSEEDGRPGARH